MVLDPERQQYEDEIGRLRAIVAEQASLLGTQSEIIAGLRSRVEELESRLDQDSGNSSLPPSRDRMDRRARRAAGRAERLPLERGAEAMEALFDAPMGEGTLAGLLPEAAETLEGFMGRIADLLKSCPVVHADETSVRVGVGLGWVHTVSTPGLTAHAKRGIDAIVDIGILNDYSGTIVHDGWSSYDRPELAGATHAQCGAHYADPAIMRNRTPGGERFRCSRGVWTAGQFCIITGSRGRRARHREAGSDRGRCSVAWSGPVPAP